MNDPIVVAAKQIKDIVEAFRTIAEALESKDNNEVNFCLTVVGLVHEYLFHEAPKEATMLVKKLETPQ